MINQYDFTEDIKAIQRVSPTLIDRIFYAINHYLPMPDLPDAIKVIVIRADSSFDAEIWIQLSTGTLLVDRTCTHTIVYANVQFSIEVNCMIARRLYCWATITDNETSGMVELKAEYHCEDEQEMALSILSGVEYAFIGSEHLLDHIHLLSSTTMTGSKFRHPNAQFSLHAYRVRRFYMRLISRIFKQPSRIVLK